MTNEEGCPDCGCDTIAMEVDYHPKFGKLEFLYCTICGWRE